MSSPSNTVQEERHRQERGGSAAPVPLTHRVNVEPSVLRGMTVTEAKVITAISIPACLFLGLVLLLLTGWWQLLMFLAVFGPIASLWFGSAKLQVLKRGRPDGYYTQALHLWFARKGLTKGRFLTHQGQWSLGRTLPFSLSHPLDPGSRGRSGPLGWLRRLRATPSTANQTHQS